jgi:hypothetical protein
MRVTFVLVALLVLSAGCAADARHGSPVSPTATSALVGAIGEPPAVVPIRVQGLVQDAAFRPLTGATVEVVAGEGTGIQTVTDEAGQFVLSGPFGDATQVRVSHGDFVPVTHVLERTQWIWFKLNAVATPVNIAGDYTLTFMADDNVSCERLPAAFRSRSYVVSITRSGLHSAFNLAIRGATILDLGYPPIGVVGNTVGFALFEDGLPYLVENVGPDAVLTITGYAQVIMPSSNESTIATPFEGWIEYVPKSSSGADPRVRCESKHHQMILTRR